MNMMKVFALTLAIILASSKSFANTDDMLMMRVVLNGPIVMEYVKSSVLEHGYTIAHEQRCDGGMTDFGYKTDFYRVIFFGKGKEVRQLSAKYPDIVSYLPLKLAIIAENKETVLTIVNPMVLEPYYNKEVRMQLMRWRNDILSIFEDVRREVAKRPDQK